MQGSGSCAVFERLLPEVLGHAEGGWGFNWGSYPAKDISRSTGRVTRQLKARIANMPDNELIARPVFRPFDEAWLHSTNAVISAEQIGTVRARILGDGIPRRALRRGRIRSATMRWTETSTMPRADRDNGRGVEDDGFIPTSRM